MSVLQRLWGGDKDKQQSKSKTKTPRNNEVDVIDATQPHNPYTELLILQHHTDIVRHLIKIDIKRCVSAADDGKVVVWDIQLGCKLAVLSGHSRPITCIVLLEGGCNSAERLVTGSSDRHIRVWDLDSGQCLQAITSHAHTVKCLLALEGGETFCTGGQDLCLWSRGADLLSSHTRTEEEADIGLMIAIRNERIIAASDKYLVVYSVGSLDDEVRQINQVKKLPSHREAIRSLINVADHLFASGSLDGTIILWTSQMLLPTKYFNTFTDYQGSTHMYPYSIQHMVCEQDRYIMAAIGCGFCLFDMGTGHMLLEKHNAHYSKILHMTFVCDGAFLATCSEDGSIRLWGQRPLSSSEASEKEDMSLGVIERFMGLNGDKLKYFHGDQVLLEPVLLGDCLAHSGAVQMLVDLDHEGLASCGVDGLVVVWKNAELQKMRRNQIVQDQVLGPTT